MRPRFPKLSAAGRWLAAGGAAFLVAGLVAGAPVLVALGSAALLGLVVGGTVALRIARAVRDGALRVRLAPAHRDLRLTVDRERSLDLRLEGPLGRRLRRTELEPGAVHPLSARVESAPAGRVLVLRSPRIGDVWLQGFHLHADVAAGLLRIETWIPLPTRLEVLPRSFATREGARLPASRSSLQDRAAAGSSRRRGFGLELRELRDHQPGDPFKHIAWAASARQGKLITREFESNPSLSVYLLVDVSPSMFWGEPGRARIDFALETAYELAAILVRRGDRVGLIVHDERVRLELPPAAGRTHLFRLLELLLEAPHLVHANRTELTDRELVDMAARWLEAQRGVRLRTRHPDGGAVDPRRSSYDEEQLLRLVEAEVAGRGRRPVPVEAYARERRRAVLRAFCRDVGVPLPLDPTPNPGGQARGLEHALESVMHTRGGPHTLVAVSDLHTADDREALRRVAIGARRHRHALIVLCPADPAFETDATSVEGPVGEALLEVMRLRGRQNVATVEAILRPAGITVLPCAPGEATTGLLRRLEQAA